MKKAITYIGGLFVAELIRRIFDIIPFEKLLQKSNFDWVIQNRFSIVDVVLFIVSLAIVFSIIKIFKIGEKRKSRLERHLEQFNCLIDNENGVKVTWNVSMGNVHNIDPHPYNIKIFCTKHDMPMLMSYGCCNDFTCPNASKHFDYNAIETQIESLLLAERDKFIKK